MLCTIPVPKEFESDFHEFFTTQLEPDLKGSLEVTIHGAQTIGVDPWSIDDWTMSDHAGVSLHKSYI